MLTCSEAASRKSKCGSSQEDHREEAGHLGPLTLPREGTGRLTAEQRNRIWQSTGVSTAVRFPDNLSEAQRQAMELLQQPQVAEIAQCLAGAEVRLTALLFGRFP